MCFVGLLSLFCEIHGPVVLMTTITISESIENLLPQIHSELTEDPAANCEYCQSFQAKTWPCLVSQEHNMTFLSSRGGGNGIYDVKSFKHVCLRSLSCESGEKWMVCDNLLNGGVLTYNFRLPDHRARGMQRLCGLSVLVMGKKQGPASCHSTSILNSSTTTNLVFPKLEAMASEMTENPDIAPVSNDKRKSLAFIHLHFSQLLSYLCLENEEFVKFSPTATTANIQMTLNLEQLRKWALNQNFVLLLTFYFLKKNFTVEVIEHSYGQCLRQLLKYLDIPLLQLRSDYHEDSCKLQLNNDEPTASSSEVLFKLTSENIIKILPNDLQEELELLTYAKKLQTILLEEADAENGDAVIAIAKLDLHKHTFSSLFRRYGKSCKNLKNIQSFKNAYELSDFDIQWLENGSKKIAGKS